MNKAKDFTGKIIKVGDKLAYPVRAGSHMWLRAMVVDNIIIPNKAGQVIQLQGINDKGNRVILEQPHRCVVIG
jgi:hypothetical protein